MMALLLASIITLLFKKGKKKHESANFFRFSLPLYSLLHPYCYQAIEPLLETFNSMSFARILEPQPPWQFSLY